MCVMCVETSQIGQALALCVPLCVEIGQVLALCVAMCVGQSGQSGQIDQMPTAKNFVAKKRC